MKSIRVENNIDNVKILIIATLSATLLATVPNTYKTVIIKQN